MGNIMLVVAYDGTKYCGWQVQKNAITIEQKIYEACQKLFSREIKIVGASRTDTGVHALGQIVVLKVETSIPINKIPYAINAYLPEDIVIRDAKLVTSSFHPRYNAKNKTYEYKIYNSRFPLPQYNRYAHFYHKSLDIDKMKKAARYFIGEHDFKAFCSTGSSVKTTVREIYKCEVTVEDKMIVISINGNGFLYNMVRIIAGTLIDVGRGKIEPDYIIDIIDSKDRSKAGATAPAKGLTLIKINYD
ncbi:tRNA pseudouridine(38-40) synthase TruA [Vallitalea guaymasensis]|uniref:tRNA pseudouridine synthase A n=1 Tax=Vallitalea guaymasensis TaxID=1185412 RepID=A0A8J8SBR0_9FIRM|nr:tRNA pseudouridine(38-40) synthase TruA [Vallitalea guaymasensis]QUH28914.1 tRNA pseudouridine(38-40) synthase TruA [Vallitalea guaymasensis]